MVGPSIVRMWWRVRHGLRKIVCLFISSPVTVAMRFWNFGHQGPATPAKRFGDEDHAGSWQFIMPSVGGVCMMICVCRGEFWAAHRVRVGEGFSCAGRPWTRDGFCVDVCLARSSPSIHPTMCMTLRGALWPEATRESCVPIGKSVADWIVFH